MRISILPDSANGVICQFTMIKRAFIPSCAQKYSFNPTGRGMLPAGLKLSASCPFSRGCRPTLSPELPYLLPSWPGGCRPTWPSSEGASWSHLGSAQSLAPMDTSGPDRHAALPLAMTKLAGASVRVHDRCVIQARAAAQGAAAHTPPPLATTESIPSWGRWQA